MKRDRATKILGLLTRQNKIEVSALAKILGVSDVTVRKDLDALEERGIIKREHGFAVLMSIENIAGRLAYHYETKRRIAERAAALVQDRETVMIESGSCCTLLAEILATERRGLTIITNSAFLADYIRQKPGAQVILLGGVYQRDSQACVGPLVAQGARNFLVDKFFAGVDGYDSRVGFMGRDHLRNQALQDMAAQAEQVVILTESSKFAAHSVVPINLGGKVRLVITDTGIEKKALQDLQGRGIEVQQVEPERGEA